MEVYKCSYTELVPIKDLKPHDRNPNKHTKEQIERLAKIIEYQGQRLPIIVSKLSGKIVAGHGRMAAMKHLKWKSVAVDYQEFENEDQEYTFVVSDNAIAEWAQLDLAMVNLELEQLGPIDIELLGLKDFVVEPIEKLDPKCDEDEVPEIKHSITKRGDIWLLGNHRVMCGDSTMIDDVEKLMNGEKFFVYADPPYGIEVVGGRKSVGGSKIVEANKYEPIIGDRTTETAKEFKHSCEALGMSNFILWGGNYFTDWLQPEKCWIVWDKKEKEWHDNFSDFEMAWSNLGKQAKIFRHQWMGLIQKGEKEKRVHPTQKPTQLHIDIFDFFKINDVFDGFLGSGSTLIACEKTNRKCYGMELDEHYCDVIINRWQNYTGKEATLEATGQTYNSLVIT